MDEKEADETLTVSKLLAGVTLPMETIALWRIAVRQELALPGSTDARLLAEIAEKLLEPAERVARAAELMAPLDVMLLRGIVANWKGSEEITLINCGDLQRQLGVALEALGAALGVEKQVRETGQTLERIAMEGR